MKLVGRIFLILLVMLVTSLHVRAEVTFNVVVLPTDLFKVCANYYCYPELSEIIANDIIDNFNATGRINSPSINYIRHAMSKDTTLRRHIDSVLTRYSKDRSLDFAAMKNISKAFNANSILLVANDVPVEKAIVRRNVWEMLVLSTNFDITYPYTMETDAILLDLVNDLVMWKGSYKKKISNNNNNFKAPNASDAYSKLEYFKMYSKDILSKNISQNIYLRFFPKTVKPMPIVSETKPEGAYFRFESDANIPALQNQLIQQQREQYRKNDEDTSDEDLLNTYYGEMIFGD